MTILLRFPCVIFCLLSGNTHSYLNISFWILFSRSLGAFCLFGRLAGFLLFFFSGLRQISLFENWTRWMGNRGRESREVGFFSREERERHPSVIFITYYLCLGKSSQKFKNQGLWKATKIYIVAKQKYAPHHKDFMLISKKYLKCCIGRFVKIPWELQSKIIISVSVILFST